MIFYISIVEVTTDTKKTIAMLLAKPEMVNATHTSLLTDLLHKYPYAQPLHLLLAQAANDTAEKGNYIAQAAFYTNGYLLHNALHNAANLAPQSLKVIKTDSNEIEINLAENQDIPVLPEVQATPDEQEVFEEIGEPTEVETLKPNSVEEEVYDEINELDIQPFVAAKPSSPESVYIETPEDLPGTNHDSFKESIPELEIESLTATDFFAFEENFKPEQFTEPETATSAVEPQTTQNIEVEERKNISKYHDEQLPYSFLWWLSKTRKEHEDIFQPYASPKKWQVVPAEKENTLKEFQQQYIENIFHIQTPFEVRDHLAEPANYDVKNAKEHQIIEKFIKEDPQIKPPKAELIDTENKAKKSAEDHYDLVSETLAKIYIEQMLYHKAIDTYKKLSLKYPEKSGYFADLIQSIEKKI